jgi:hypothetical protein
MATVPAAPGNGSVTGAKPATRPEVQTPALTQTTGSHTTAGADLDGLDAALGSCGPRAGRHRKTRAGMTMPGWMGAT